MESDIICVTDRRQCGEDFIVRLGKIARARPRAVILREKDLSEEEYGALAARAMRVCAENGTRCVLHNFADLALRLGAGSFHAPLPVIKGMTEAQRARFSVLGASCHSLADAAMAESLGCAYVTVGHIFATDSKKGLPGRGLGFLGEICAQVKIPVYAIGGISPENIASVRGAGAAGACVMGLFMRCEDPGELMGRLKKG